ncbi:hypothetical protein U2F10_24125 [Leptothoe sp. EHU-05/26/07-4]
MKRSLKRKIRRLWRDRLLVSVGSLIIVAFSGVQLQTVLKHRNPDYPSWSLDLFQSVEVLTDEKASEEAKEAAIFKALSISEDRFLSITKWSLLNRNKDDLFSQQRDLILAIAQAQVRVQTPAMSLSLKQIQAQAQDLAQDRDRDLYQALALEGTRAQIQGLFQAFELKGAQIQAQGLDSFLKQDLEQVRAREQIQAQAQALNQALSVTWPQAAEARTLDLALDQVLSLSMGQDWELDPFLKQDLKQAQQQALDLGLATSLTDDIFVGLLISAELERTHRLTLQTGNTLKKLSENEQIRARTSRRSGFLLGGSAVALFLILATFLNLQGSSSLPRTANLIAFLPEEYVAELGYLQRRLKKQKASPWQIKRRLFHEFLFLLWVHYVQMQIDKLFLESNKDHTIDD